MKRYRDIAGDGGSNIVGQVEAQQARLVARRKDVRAIVAVVSGKGGVGKSSVTANLAGAFALGGARVGVLDADLNGPTMAKMLGVRGRTLEVGPGGVEPPAGALGIRVMSMDLLLADDATPLTWDAPSQAEAHTWRGTMEANALREFLADTAWGALDMLLIDLPPGRRRGGPARHAPRPAPVTARFCQRCGRRLRIVSEDGRRRPRCPRCGWTFYANPAPAAVAVVMHGGRVLLARRTREPYAGTWDLPGGFLEQDEVPLEGLRRELREEIGVGI